MRLRLKFSALPNSLTGFFGGRKSGERKGNGKDRGKRERRGENGWEGERFVRLGGRLLPFAEGNGRACSLKHWFTAIYLH